MTQEQAGSSAARRPRGDDHPNSGPHTECQVNHGGKDVPRHCRRGCKWPCPDESVDPRASAASGTGAEHDCGDAGECPIHDALTEVFTIERGPSIYIDGTGDFYIRRPGRPGILATVVLPLNWKDKGR